MPITPGYGVIKDGFNADLDELRSLATNSEQWLAKMEADIKLLMDTFWPGPLTITLPKSDLVPDRATGGYLVLLYVAHSFSSRSSCKGS